MKTNCIFYLLFFGLFSLLLLCAPKVRESFQRMNYIQLHDYLDCKQQYGQSSPYCEKRYKSQGEIDYGMFYRPSYGYHTHHTAQSYGSGYNQPYQVGYLTSEDEDNNDIYGLFQVYDYKRGKQGYAFRDSKDNGRDAVLVNIDPDQYRSGELYDGDVVTITYEDRPFVVKLYKIKTVGLGTRYSERDYRNGMYEYALLNPVDSGNGNIDEDDRYFILYEQELDPRRGVSNYYVKDKRGLLIDLDLPKNKKLYDGDTIIIPGKEKYGEYKLDVFDRF